MLPQARFGKTELRLTRIGLGGFPFGGINHARGWDPFTSEGRAQAVRTVHAALNAGINIIDTAPAYGDGNSESIVGEATHDRRDRVYLATKVQHEISATEVVASVEESLQRLRTDFIDIIQFHGGMFTDQEVHHILHEGLIDALHKLRDQGKVRFIGFSVEEPWTARSLIASGQFDTMQIRYNLIHQGAAWHMLDEALDMDMGVLVMRSMTSGIFQRLTSYIAPEWQAARDQYEVALKYVLSDSRVHVALVGMRWREEIEKNVAVVESFEPSFDIANLPRFTSQIYATEDQMADENGT